MSNVIYTAIFGNYDDLKRPLIITPGWRYICYTDQPIKSDVWEIKPVDILGTAISTARYWKIGRFDFHYKSIWVDASFTINCNLDKFWKRHFVSPMTVVKHPMRNCIYDEAQTCIQNKRGNDKDILMQIEKYKAEEMPELWGLIQSGIILRENTEAVRNFCELWWQQISLSTRDQIGFAYAEWKTGIKWPRIEMDYRTSKDFIFKTHFHRRKVDNRQSNRNL